MIYYTGDIHGAPNGIVRFAKHNSLTPDDTIVILGDVGANYYGDERDRRVKKELNSVKSIVFCIHGNHEMRPETIGSYRTKIWNGGIVWFEDKYPNLLFAKDGEIYDIEKIRHIVFGGAYSVDKQYRLLRGYGWWENEQPSPEIKCYVENQIKKHTIDIVLSHTCPKKYIPTEMFLPMVNQTEVDQSTEEWLDKIEESISYKAWFCGHWHTNKRIDKMHFLYYGFESADSFMKEVNNS